MAYIDPTTMATHLYLEIQNEVVRNDNAIVQSAIDTALSEVRGYITKYDMDAEMQLPENARNMKLLSVVKDVAAWHIIRLCNPNIEIDFRLQLYEQALAWLKMVQAGKIDPQLPLPEIDNNGGLDENGNLNGSVKWESNFKRRNQF